VDDVVVLVLVLVLEDVELDVLEVDELEVDELVADVSTADRTPESVQPLSTTTTMQANTGHGRRGASRCRWDDEPPMVTTE
jgi:hypothetical protein